jgi:uncharacterized damage-inducible protein DinB
MNIAKPQLAEGEYYKPFVDLVKTEFLEAELRQNLNEMSLFLADLSSEKWNSRYAQGKWTIGEVLMHILDVEHMFVHRAFWVQREMGEGLISFDHDAMAENSLSVKCTPSRFLELYEAQRNYTLAFAKTLKLADWDKKGNVEGNEFDLRLLYYVICGHERHHLNVVKERYL